MTVPVRCLILLLGLWLAACKRESFTTSPADRLQTSADTLHFDTVFTTAGSVSQVVKIINPHSKGIRIDALRLAGGNASSFRINADGIPGPQVTGLSIPARDSILVFVTVTVSPSAAPLPFLVRDSFEISYGVNRSWVQLQAFGQNAVFLRNATISTNTVWNAELPYVILGGLTVAPGAQLTMGPGCRVYFNAGAPLIVRGSLQVMGNVPDSARVVFTGDRLDEPYRNYPASFPGIIFTETSTANLLRYAIVRNAYQGIVINTPPAGTPLVLEETIIENAYDAGLLAVNSGVRARNLLIANCGKNLVLVKGGQYTFTHCTFAAYSTAFLQHKDPVLLLTNFVNEGGQPSSQPLNATFRNCIFWGEGGGLVNSEVVIGRQGNQPFSALFDNVLWRVPSDPAGATVSGNNLKTAPLFDSIHTASRYFDFRLKAGSPALEKGSPAGVPLDLDGRPRPVGLPDLGAYERQ